MDRLSSSQSGACRDQQSLQSENTLHTSSVANMPQGANQLIRTFIQHHVPHIPNGSTCANSRNPNSERLANPRSGRIDSARIKAAQALGRIKSTF